MWIVVFVKCVYRELKDEPSFTNCNLSVGRVGFMQLKGSLILCLDRTREMLFRSANGMSTLFALELELGSTVEMPPEWPILFTSLTLEKLLKLW